MSELKDLLQLPYAAWHGLRLDLSFIGYLLIVPVLLSFFQPSKHVWVSKFLKIYHIILFILVGIIAATDPFFFHYWGQKCNLSFTQFLGNDNAGFYSVRWSHYLAATAFLATLFLLFYKKWMPLPTFQMDNAKWTTILLFPIIFLMIRSSFDKAPIGITSAYYSANPMYNSAAINASWSFIAIESESKKNKPIKFMSDEEAQEVLAKMEYRNTGLDTLLKHDEIENVLLIVLESFAAFNSGFLSGNEKTYTPNLDNLMQRSVCFTNCYSSSFRSDKGLMALVTGTPSLARQTLTNFADIIAQKDNIFKVFQGFEKRFYYGGNLEFANMKSLFMQCDKIVSEDDFDSKNKTAWGIHDEIVFERFFDDFDKTEKKQFLMMFSLSSHEPFDVPNYKKYSDLYENSIAYTDSCLGVFISKLEKSREWKNTLLIVTADHGRTKDSRTNNYDKVNFKIPLLISGGVIKNHAVIEDIVSQTEVFGFVQKIGDNEKVDNKSNLFQSSNRAFYSYFDGICEVTPDCHQCYDLISKKYSSSGCSPLFMQAYYQNKLQQFFKR
ncbi:MAG: LTA synthase family protein [Flavobacteriales bacterium]|nr:LTA synthase family protein [Flavobacteriales bacterium]